MSSRTLLVLLMIVAALLGFIWFYERDIPSSDERRESADRVLSHDPDEVSWLELEADGRRAVFERREDEWFLVEPVVGHAKEGRLMALLEALAALQASRTLTSPDLESLGLDPPVATVALWVGNERRDLMIGAQVPASTSRVVAIDAWWRASPARPSGTSLWFRHRFSNTPRGFVILPSGT